ncbi:MAG: PEP-CTERM sorting domain-containing protein [Trichodesmium sp.]
MNTTAQAASLGSEYIDYFKSVEKQDVTEQVGLEGSRVTEGWDFSFASDSSVELFFMTEGAMYDNGLNYFSSDSNNSSGVAWDVASTDMYSATQGWLGRQYLPDGDGGYIDTKDSPENPLMPADSVVLGNFKQGSSLNFELSINSGLSGGNPENPDTINTLNNPNFFRYHDMGNGLFIVRFEDDTTENSDMDYNDLVFAMKVTESVPEPTTTLALLGVGTAGLLGLRRRK